MPLARRVARRGHDLVRRRPTRKPRAAATTAGTAALVGHRGQLDHHDVASGVGGVGGRLERQPGLAHAAGAHDRDQPLGRPSGGAASRARARGRPSATPAGAGLGGPPAAAGASARRRAGRPARPGARPRAARRPGSRPVSSASRRRKSWAARSASACRPARGERSAPAGHGCARAAGRRRAARLASATSSGPRPPRPVAAGQAQPSQASVSDAAQLLQRDGLGGERCDVGELVEGRAPPEAEGGVQHASGRRRGAGSLGHAAGLGHVELVGSEVEAVAVAVRWPASRRPGRGGARSRETWLCSARRPESGISSGQTRVEQLVGRHGSALGHGQQGEHRPPPGTGDLHRRAVDGDPQRAQQLDPHLAAPPVSTACSPTGSSCSAVLVACPVSLPVLVPALVRALRPFLLVGATRPRAESPPCNRRATGCPHHRLIRHRRGPRQERTGRDRRSHARAPCSPTTCWPASTSGPRSTTARTASSPRTSRSCARRATCSPRCPIELGGVGPARWTRSCGCSSGSPTTRPPPRWRSTCTSTGPAWRPTCARFGDDRCA